MSAGSPAAGNQWLRLIPLRVTPPRSARSAARSHPGIDTRLVFAYAALMKALHLTALTVALPTLLFMNDADAQPAGYNYDEAKVPAYTLPDPLLAADGSKITTAAQWQKSRRAETLKLFEQEVYGRQLGKLKETKFEVNSVERGVLGGKAVRKQITLHLLGEDKEPKLHVLMYLPAAATKPVPVFVGYNFDGNHAVNADPGIELSTNWLREANAPGIKDHRATEEGRGREASRWAVDKILERGYGVVTAYYGDIEPDHAEGWKDGLRAKIKTDAAGKTLPLEEWSAISAWAWGLSRVMDYLETDDNVNTNQVAVMGHSRLGKTALWAGATDERFAITISNESGCGGAALSRRIFGETVKRINTSFPHWFCANYKKYNDNEAACPVDQHQLIALLAPRPVYVASAAEDLWADPNGEFLGAKHAEPVYALFGKRGLGAETQPPVNTPVGDSIGYHVRTGKHDVTEYDWEQYLNFADRHFGRKR